MADCFTADAVVEVVGQSRLEGREAIARTQETPSTNRHFVLNVWVIDGDDATAHVRTYFVITDATAAPIGHGRYDDDLCARTTAHGGSGGARSSTSGSRTGTPRTSTAWSTTRTVPSL